MRRITLAASLFATAVAAQGKPSPLLEQARRLLGERAEAPINEGADLCLQANNVPAVEALLEVMQQTERRTHLHLAPGHYRDICWDRLTKITDLYARRRVEHELRTGKDPHVRAWCAELLGIYGETGFGAMLQKALGAKDDVVVQHAARALGLLKFEPATAALQARAKDGNDYIRANAIEALARVGPAHTLAYKAAIAQDKSGGVRCALLGAGLDLLGEDLEPTCLAACKDPDWRPRMQAVRLLGGIKTKSAVDGLIAALRDGRPAVGVRAQRELQELTRQPIQQTDVWEKWWADNRATFAFPDQRGVAKRDVGTVAYNGVPVDSDHVAFLIDKSVMMRQRLTSKGATKEAAAQEELAQVLQKLDEAVAFNVFLYDTTVRSLEKKSVKLTAKARKQALAFAAAPCEGREKDIW
ncbi:MAG: hypothetical protein FJ306_10055 [Planctomycetes bacterium]|nr:hypothetical protein [Planctomycetota bacterium]